MLQNVRENGDWELWCEFFLKCIIEAADQARDTIKIILDRFEVDLEHIKKSSKCTTSLLETFHHVQKRSVITSKVLERETKLSKRTSIRNLQALESLGILKEITGKPRGKIYCYKKFLDILS